MIYSIDCDWLSDPDIPRRLIRGRKLLRDTVRLVFYDQCIVDWSKASAPYLGVMVHTQPKQVYINPGPVLRHRGENTKPLTYALIGVALHEASHAVNTPPQWGDLLEAALSHARGRFGHPLTAAFMQLIHAIGNWVEDVWVEGCLPAYYDFFSAVNKYHCSDRKCMNLARRIKLRDKILTDAQDQIPEDRHLFALDSINLLSVLVNRPGVVEAVLPSSFTPLIEAAHAIHTAGTHSDAACRVQRAIEITEDVYRHLLPFLPPPESKSSAIRRSLNSPQNGIRRDRADPTGAERTRSRLSDVQEAAMDAYARREAHEEVSSAMHGAASRFRQTASGRALLQNKEVRIMDSSRDTLPFVGDFESKAGCSLEVTADYLLGKYRHLLLPLRGQLSPRYGNREKIRLGQDEGDEIDTDDLPEFSYRRIQRVPANRLDLTVLVDESASMGASDRWEMAALSTLLLEECFRPLYRNGLRLRVYGFTADCFQAGETVLFRHYDSLVPHLCRRNALAWCYPKASTPTGIALAAMRREILRSRRMDSLPCLLLLTDGLPEALGYSGEPARLNVQSEVEEMLGSSSHGNEIKFSCLQIDPSGLISREMMNQMYIDYWERVRVATELPTAIVRLVSRWFQK